MPSNNAAWLKGKGIPLEINAAPYTQPKENEIVIKTEAVAINPVDNVMQDLAIFPVSYPTILGRDVAGTVVEVGEGVSRFKTGDRVLGLTIGFATRQDSHNAFQEYSVLTVNTTSPIPNDMSFERAAVIPLGLSTAAAGLFQTGYLSLDNPSLSPKSNGKTLLIWGGASSVGSSAIQIAVAAGYEVFTTSSAKNFQFVKKLGAAQVFDYNDPTVVDDVVMALEGKDFVGAFDSISRGAIEKVSEIVARSKGIKIIATTLPVPAADTIPPGITIKQPRATDIKDNEVSKIIFEDFLPRALAEGKFVPAPEPYVAGQGLESIQEAMNTAKKGVSAMKVVVLL